MTLEEIKIELQKMSDLFYYRSGPGNMYGFFSTERGTVTDEIWLCTDAIMVAEHIKKCSNGRIVVCNKEYQETGKDFHEYSYQEDMSLFFEHVKKLCIEYKMFDVEERKQKMEKDFE